MTLSPTMQAGLEAVYKLGGVKVNKVGRPVVSGQKHGVMVDAPNNRTLQALIQRGLVEKYQCFTSVVRGSFLYYRITPKGRAVLDA